MLVNSYFFFLVLWSTRTKKTRTAFYLSQLVLFTLVNSYFIIGQVVLLPNRTPFVILRLIRVDNCIKLWSNQCESLLGVRLRFSDKKASIYNMYMPSINQILCNTKLAT